MPETAKYDLGELEGIKYTLFVQVNPSWDNPEKFVATIFYRKFEPKQLAETKIEVVRIDNKAHGTVHMDKLYEKGEPKEKLEMDFYEAWTHLKQNWQKYANRFQNK